MSDLIGRITTSAAEPFLDREGVEAARLVRNARDRLVSESPSVTYTLLAEARATTANAARQWVHRHRVRIVTVDHNGTTLIPSFQFDSDYELIPEVTASVQALNGKGMSDWAIWTWFCTEDPWIERAPLDLVRSRDWETLAELVEQFGIPS